MDSGDAVGLDRDEMKELGNELWRIADGYNGESGGDGEEVMNEMDEDEE